jgi:prophage regulatory protein
MPAKHISQTAEPTLAIHPVESEAHVTTESAAHNGSKPDRLAADQTVGAPPILLRLPTVMRITGLARSTIYKLIAQNQFPAPIKLSKRAVAWLQSEIEGWVSTRVRAH